MSDFDEVYAFGIFELLIKKRTNEKSITQT